MPHLKHSDFISFAQNAALSVVLGSYIQRMYKYVAFKVLPVVSIATQQDLIRSELKLTCTTACFQLLAGL